MDNDLKKIIIELKEVIDLMLENIENKHALKFLAGKFSLLTNTLLDIMREN